MQNSARWYALYTRRRWEKKVANLLSAKKIENYCPVNKVHRQWSDRKKIVTVPLFSCYVFVRIDEEQHSLARETDGVINFVYWLHKPAIIRDEEITLIQKFLGEYENVQLERITVQHGDMIRITNGALMGHQGVVLSTSGKVARVMLPSLGFMITAEVNPQHIEILR